MKTPEGLTKYGDLYDLLDALEEEKGWLHAVEVLAAALDKIPEIRDGEGPDALDYGDTQWEICLIDKDVKSRTWMCDCGHVWSQPVEYADTTNLSGEKTVWCPKCNKRAVEGSPVFTYGQEE